MKVIGIINDCGKRNWGGEKMKQICPTLKAEAHGNLPKVVMIGGGGGLKAMIKIKQATKKGYIECIEGGACCIAFPESKLRRGRVIDEGRTAPTLDTGCQIGVVQAGQIYGTEKEPNPKAGRVFSIEGLSPCLGTVSGGNTMPLIAVKPVLTPQGKHGVLLNDGRIIRIRRLTPKECFRLQGWTDDYFEKAAFVNSDSQLYKQAGNGVTVNVVRAIGELIGK